MSTSYRAMALVGVKLPLESDLPRLQKSVRKKAFPHNFPDDENHKFDPKTGNPLWLNEFELTDSDEPSVVYQVDDYCDVDLVAGQKVLKGDEDLGLIESEDDFSDSVFYYGVILKTGSSDNCEYAAFMALPNIDALKEKIRKILEPLNLWDESKFGLYSILTWC